MSHEQDDDVEARRQKYGQLPRQCSSKKSLLGRTPNSHAIRGADATPTWTSQSVTPAGAGSRDRLSSVHVTEELDEQSFDNPELSRRDWIVRGAT